LLQYYRGEIKFESDLLSNRLNSFMASQSFLLLAYASAMDGLIGRWHYRFALQFPAVVALLGLLLALQALPGIRASSIVLTQWHGKQSALFAASADLEAFHLTPASATKEAGTDDAIARWQRQGMVFATRAPWMFAGAWCYFIGLAIYLYWRG